MPTFIDLFSGAGGLGQGFQDAGFLPVYAVEYDKYAYETHASNHPIPCVDGPIDITSHSCEDVMTAAGLKSGQLDVLIGGPPCQGFSNANRQSRFLDNPNNRMVKEYMRFVKELRPKAFVMENVEGLLSLHDGVVAEELQEAFEALQYNVAVGVLNAADYGVAQQRKRVVFFGLQDGTPSLPKPFLTPEEYFTVGMTIGDLPAIQSGEIRSEMEYSNGPQNAYQEFLRNGAPKVFNHETTKNNELVLQRYQYIKQGENWRAIPNYLMMNYKNKSRCHSSIYKRLEWSKPSITVSNYRKSMFIHPTQDRGLSVREAARLQSFKDTFIFKGKTNAKQQQVANAVPPLLGQAIAEQAAHSLGIKTTNLRSSIRSIRNSLAEGVREPYLV